MEIVFFQNTFDDPILNTVSALSWSPKFLYWAPFLASPIMEYFVSQFNLLWELCQNDYKSFYETDYTV